MRISLAMVLAMWMAGACHVARGMELHVAPDGNDRSSGSAEKPLAHIERARNLIRDMIYRGELPAGGVTVVLHAGTYYLDHPLIFEPQDSGTQASPIVYTAADKATVVISGGRPIVGWKNVKGNLWTVELPDVKADRWYFRQLFAGGQRLDRARIPSTGFLYTNGPLSQYAAVTKRGDKNGKILRDAHPDACCGFNFNPGAIQAWPDADDAEVIRYDSWEASWQTIRRIDEHAHDIYFNTPSRYPVGNFTLHSAYRIENVLEGMTVPGQWQLDWKTGVLSYLSKPGEDPNSMGIVAPAMEKLVVFQGDYKSRQYVDHIALRGITFSHTNYPMGIYDLYNWPADVLKVDPTWPRVFAPGYTDAQAAPLCGQAIEMNSARGCSIESCELAHIGAYGIGIFTGSSNDRVIGCFIHDAGGGGVLVRYPSESIKGLNKTDAPHDNLVQNNTIRHISLVHPSAVGILVGQAYGNKFIHNEISDGGYTGIHLGWTWGSGANYTGDNLIEANDIHNVMRDMVDGGGLYSLGVEPGNVYMGNFIHSIERAKIAGGPTAAIYFDHGSRTIDLEHNVVRDVKKVLNFNVCTAADMTWKDNYLSAADDAAPGAQAQIDQIIHDAGPEAPYRR